jgi:hypothetical protein
VPATAVPPSPDPEGVPLRSPAMIAVALVAAVCIALSVSYRIYDPDIWENLVVGKAIWQLHRVPTTQLWSWPTYGAPDVKWTWGFSALVWPVWERAGVWGLFAWRWATALVSFGLLWAAARKMGARGFVPLVAMVVCSLVWRARSQVRPETLAAVLLAAQVWILETRRHGGKDRSWWLVAVAWAWANVHNTWFLGFGVTGIHLLHDLVAGRGRGARRSGGARGAAAPRGGAAARGSGAAPGPARASGAAPVPARATGGRWQLAWVGIAALAISFVNPYGWRALWQPFDFFLNHRNEPIFKTIGELGPVDWSIYWRKGLPFLVAGWPLLALWRARRRGPDLVELLSCAAFTALALPAQRFLGLYALVAAPYVSRDLAEWLAAVPFAAKPAGQAPRGAPAAREPAEARDARAPWPARVPLAARAGLAALACVGVGWAEWARPEMPIGIGFMWNKYPVAACDFMAAHDVRGRGFNQFGFAGYQLYRFWPDRTRLPFMDIHQAGTKDTRYVYAWVQQSEEAWRTLDRTYTFDYALVGRGIFERYSLLNQLDADSTWAMVFVDDVMAIYVRRAGPLSAVARDFAYRELPGGARRLVSMGEASEGDSLLRARIARELEREIAESPQHAQALILKASIALAENRHAEARDLARRAIALDPLHEGAHMRLALIALEEGQAREALREVELERAIGDPSARHDVVAGQAWAMLGDKAKARAAYRRALKRDPANAQARDSIATLGDGG